MHSRAQLLKKAEKFTAALYAVSQLRNRFHTAFCSNTGPSGTVPPVFTWGNRSLRHYTTSTTTYYPLECAAAILALPPRGGSKGRPASLPFRRVADPRGGRHPCPSAAWRTCCSMDRQGCWRKGHRDRTVICSRAIVA